MSTFYDVLTQLHIGVMPRAILLIVFGFFAARLLSKMVSKALSNRFSRHHTMVLKRILFYLIFLIFIASAFQQLGFRITALLGATGILTIALAFASQTAMSNLISGLFIIGEKPFQIGDKIKMSDTTGEVMSIDFLSVKLRTDNNAMVRIPNETVIKSTIANLSYFPYRRIDLTIGVGYKENLRKVEKILFAIAEKNTDCLADPKPFFLIQGFGDSAITLQFSVWGTQENYYALKNSIQADIHQVFTEKNIEIPFPARALYKGNNTEPLPVKIIS